MAIMRRSAEMTHPSVRDPAALQNAGRRHRSLDCGPSARDDGDDGSTRNFFDVYVIDHLLGAGAFSKVYKCTNRRTRQAFAVKIMKFTAKQTSTLAAGQEVCTREQVEAELSICSTLEGCPGMVGLRRTFHDTHSVTGNGLMYAVFDLVEGGELLAAVTERGSLPEDDAQGVMRSLFRTCSVMHRRGVVHRDIKLDNILLKDAHRFDTGVMLTDLGLAGVLPCDDNNSQQLHEVCGTPTYMAPEMLRFERAGSSPSGKLRSQGYGHEVDVWGCGVVLYILLCGFPPFEGKSYREQFEQVATAEVCFDDPAWVLVSTEAKDLVLRCLERNPSDRITADEADHHPWLTQTQR